MFLHEILSKAPRELLSKIAQAVTVDPAAPGREDLVQAVTDRLLNSAWLEQRLAQLGPEEWTALKVVYFNGGDQGITVELCHQIVNLQAGKRRKASAKAIEDLQHYGLIYARTLNYRQVLYLPADLFEAVGVVLHQQMVERVCLPAGAKVRVTLSERDLTEDAHRFLIYVYRHEITLTQQGQIFKRHLKALLDLLLTPLDDEASLVGRYPEPLGLLVGYTLDRHLIVRADGQLRPSPDLQLWVDQPAGAKQLDLFAYWQDRYFYQDLQTFLSVIRTVQHAEWISVVHLIQEIEPLINPSQRGSFLLRLKHHLSTFLAPMGLFELGEHGDPAAPEMVCRLTSAGMAVVAGRAPLDVAEQVAQPAMVLQATFEVIVPRPVAAAVLWQLELMAELVRRTDRTLTYRLTRQSIFQGLRQGLTGETILAFFQAHSSTGVPQNVAFDLEEWVRSYGQVYLQAVTLLRCATPLLAQQVKASRRTARFVLGELSATDLIVRGSEYRELLEALEADGLMPRPDVERLG